MVTFRRATTADVPAILALHEDDDISFGREIVSDPPEPCYAQAFVAIDADPSQLLAVAEIDGRVVGTLQLTIVPYLSFRGSPRGIVENVHLASDVRGRGLGTAFMHWALDQAKARGVRAVQLTSKVERTDAHRFYERLGFAATHVGMKVTVQPGEWE
jgi:GNAT superfamily N-acetyltransferase